MKIVLLDIGNGHTVHSDRVTSILKYGSRSLKRLKEQYEKQNRCIDVSGAKKVSALILVDGYLFCSSVSSDTLNKRRENIE
jgi:regulator of extracellular matrix RemA (YlzA/DUF370 family)